MRIHELSKMINVSNKEIIAKLAGLGITVKSHMSKVDDEALKKLEYIFGKKVKAAAKKKSTAKAQKPPIIKGKSVTEKPETEVKKKAVSKKATAEKEKPVEKKTAKATMKSDPASEAKKEVDAPEKLAKETDSEKIAKFKKKPGMQRAFDSVRRVETSNRSNDFRGRNKKQDRKHSVKPADATEAISHTAPRKRVLKFQEGTTVKEFCELIGQKLNDVIKKFMELGYMTTINQPLDSDSAQIVAELYGLKLEPTAVEDDEAILEEQEIDESKLKPRSPIVTIMGHVDHGKTTLLDAIRETRVTETEAGGITQHIGAYKVKLKEKEITFLDTPGHAAFTMMRARGAKVTDIVVLVVAADDSVMPQTIEAIDHAKAANVPIVVAVNKIDKEDADAQKVQNELAQYDVIPEDWGGSNIFIEVSAKEQIGIEHLLEMILLQSEMMELKADYSRLARGTIVEAKLDKGRGPVGTVLVNSGTLRAGDSFLVGTIAGRVRALVDDQGKKITEAGPSTPVEVIGFPEVPQAGDIFTVIEDEKKARQIAVNRLHKKKNAAMAQKKKLTLDDLFERVKEGEIRDLNIIIKADVQGSVEAVKDALLKIKHPEVKVNVIHTGAGGINESDVMLAAASNAIIIGFSVRPDANAAPVIEKEGVDVRLYNIIYEAIDDIKKALEGLLEPTITEKIIGKAEVRDLFQISKLGTIAGCHVIEGKMSKSSFGARVIRDSVVIYESKLSSLKRFKDDAKEVLTGFECGIMIDNFNDLKQGDIIENYIMDEVAGKLE